MFAIVKTGGKQYRVVADDILKVEKLDGEKGDKILLTDVLLIANGDKQTVGTPSVSGAAVEAEVIAQGRAKKIIVFKKKRRQNYRRKAGHRQDITVLKVTKIIEKGAKATTPTSKSNDVKPAAVKKTAAKKATSKKAAAKKPAAKK